MTHSTTNTEMPAGPESSSSAAMPTPSAAHIAITRCSKRPTRSAKKPNASLVNIPAEAVIETIAAASPREMPNDS